MEISTSEVKDRFDEAAAAAVRGERVVVTRDGHPFVELVTAQGGSETYFEKAARVRRALGLDGAMVEVSPDFDDPSFSRRVLGLHD